jgi:hypothetical protein
MATKTVRKPMVASSSPVFQGLTPVCFHQKYPALNKTINEIMLDIRIARAVLFAKIKGR